MFDLFFLIHILAIMAAFGPTFTFPMIAAMNKRTRNRLPSLHG